MQGKCIIIMGVSGSGKSTVAAVVAKEMNAQFIEGDSMHPQGNIDKMSSGVPLSDDDRKGWLQNIHSEIKRITEAGNDCVVSCSALKYKYRNVLRTGIKNILFIYLKGSYELIRERLTVRQQHFMPINLLESQFADLEEPDEKEQDVITININKDFNKEIFSILSQSKFTGNTHNQAE